MAKGYQNKEVQYFSLTPVDGNVEVLYGGYCTIEKLVIIEVAIKVLKTISTDSTYILSGVPSVGGTNRTLSLYNAGIGAPFPSAMTRVFTSNIVSGKSMDVNDTYIIKGFYIL